MKQESAVVKFITWNAEITDTFGGEANYSWVRRYSQQFPVHTSERVIVQHFKKLMGYTGVKCRRAKFSSDMIELRPYGECRVIFITPEY